MTVTNEAQLINMYIPPNLSGSVHNASHEDRVDNVNKVSEEQPKLKIVVTANFNQH